MPLAFVPLIWTVSIFCCGIRDGGVFDVGGPWYDPYELSSDCVDWPRRDWVTACIDSGRFVWLLNLIVSSLYKNEKLININIKLCNCYIDYI